MFPQPFIAGQTIPVIGSPVNAQGKLSPATLSSTVYTSSDESVFTVAPDPNNPNGAIITAVGDGTATSDRTATLTETALATEPDGTTTETIAGTDTITVNPSVAPPPSVAASLVFTYGTPTTAPVTSGTAGVDKAHS